MAEKLKSGPKVIGTSACIWCAEPVNLYKNHGITLYCSGSHRHKSSCRNKNSYAVRRYNGKYAASLVRRRKRK